MINWSSTLSHNCFYKKFKNWSCGCRSMNILGHIKIAESVRREGTNVSRDNLFVSCFIKLIVLISKPKILGFCKLCILAGILKMYFDLIKLSVPKYHPTQPRHDRRMWMDVARKKGIVKSTWFLFSFFLCWDPRRLWCWWRRSWQGRASWRSREIVF